MPEPQRSDYLEDSIRCTSESPQPSGCIPCEEDKVACSKAPIESASADLVQGPRTLSQSDPPRCRQRREKGSTCCSLSSGCKQCADDQIGCSKSVLHPLFSKKGERSHVHSAPAKQPQSNAVPRLRSNRQPARSERIGQAPVEQRIPIEAATHTRNDPSEEIEDEIDVDQENQEAGQTKPAEETMSLGVKRKRGGKVKINVESQLDAMYELQRVMFHQQNALLARMTQLESSLAALSRSSNEQCAPDPRRWLRDGGQTQAQQQEHQMQRQRAADTSDVGGWVGCNALGAHNPLQHQHLSDTFSLVTPSQSSIYQTIADQSRPMSGMATGRSNPMPGYLNMNEAPLPSRHNLDRSSRDGQRHRIEQASRQQRQVTERRIPMLGYLNMAEAPVLSQRDLDRMCVAIEGQQSHLDSNHLNIQGGGIALHPAGGLSWQGPGSAPYGPAPMHSLLPPSWSTLQAHASTPQRPFQSAQPLNMEDVSAGTDMAGLYQGVPMTGQTYPHQAGMHASLDQASTQMMGQDERTPASPSTWIDPLLLPLQQPDRLMDSGPHFGSNIAQQRARMVLDGLDPALNDMPLDSFPG